MATPTETRPIEVRYCTPEDCADPRCPNYRHPHTYELRCVDCGEDTSAGSGHTYEERCIDCGEERS